MPRSIDNRDLRLMAEIDYARRKADFTAADAAEAIGISRSTWSNRVKDPGSFTVRELRRLKRAIGLDNEILERIL